MSSSRAVRVAVAFARQAAAAPPARLCRACVEVLNVSGAGVTLMSGTHSGPVCAAGELTEALEDLQFTLGEGPTSDAHTSGKPVTEPDLEHASAARWPSFIPPALAIGARGVFSFPLRTASGRIGVLTLYQRNAGALSDEQTADGLLIADVLALTILTTQAKSTSSVLVDELTDDNAHRAEVHQASGMVAVQLGVAVSDALARLRAYAYANDRPVATVARDVVARRVRLGNDRNGDGPE